MFGNWTDHIVKQWQLEKLGLNKDTSSSAISNAEKVINFNFPDQFKELYLKVNGFKDLDWRENLFTIWPIDKIVEEYQGNRGKNFIGLLIIR